jgi:anti-sigma factor RsiW
MSNRQNISASGHEGGTVSPEELQAYLDGSLDPARQHAVEQWLEEEGMESDAMDGLMDLAPDDAKQRVSTLNAQLHRHLSAGSRRRKRPITDNRWAWVAIAIVLLLCLLGYVVLVMV